jgi:hypothetical protein
VSTRECNLLILSVQLRVEVLGIKNLENTSDEKIEERNKYGFIPTLVALLKAKKRYFHCIENGQQHK